MIDSFTLMLSDLPLSPALPEASQQAVPPYTDPMFYRKEVTLRDGTKATLRPIQTGDKAALIEFHNRLSQDTKFLRYHYSKGDLTYLDLKTFCEVDYRNTMALIVEGIREGKPRILGVGRYSRLPVDHTAEVAFVVEDSEQSKGLGSLLLKHLAEFAWQSDIRFFYGEVLRQNGKMLSIFRKSDPSMKQEVDCPSTCTITVSVDEARQRMI
jgi:GNAT superfamily N-acetyltransferase